MKLADEDKTKSRAKVSAAEDKMNEDLMNDIFNDLAEGRRISNEAEKEKIAKQEADARKEASRAEEEQRKMPSKNKKNEIEQLDTRGFEDLDNMLVYFEVENLDLKPINQHTTANVHDSAMDIEISGPKP